MNCDVIKDLLPLYIDGCCSTESQKLVSEHLDSCHECEKLYRRMSEPVENVDQNDDGKSISDERKRDGAKKHFRVNEWKASLLQSLLLYISFLIITVGVAAEASTPLGLENDIWAFSVVVPASGFLLSLANFYFIRLYKSKRAFSIASCAATFGFTFVCFIITLIHYEGTELIFSPSLTLSERFEIFGAMISIYSVGVILTAAFCVISKIASRKYAEFLGKE